MASDFQPESFGQYELTHLLGQGGMATVYRALRSGPMGFAKEVAIKRLHDKLNDNDAVLKALINEARLGGQLKHRNIVEVYEFNKVDDQYYMAMEFVDGWTLDTVQKLAIEHDLPMPPEVVLDIVVEVCEGLHYAHTLESLEGEEVKLVHRDLKPANIILARDGTSKVMDFGIAKAQTNLFKTTLADTTKGTPHYMSPEQVAGDPNIERTSDIFAMGTVLYELLTGKLLFGGDSLVAVLFAVARADVEGPLADLDREIPGIAAILGRCLAKAPADRYPTAEALANALRGLRRTLDSDQTVRGYIYALREKIVGKEAAADGDVQFATLAVTVPEEMQGKGDELEATRRAADAALTTMEDDAGATRLMGSQTTLDKPGLATRGPMPAREGDYEETRVFTAGDTVPGKRNRGALWIALLLLVVGGGAGAWILLGQPKPEPVAAVRATPTPAPTATPAPTPLTDLAVATPTPRPERTPRPGKATPKPRSTPRPTPAAVAAATPPPEPKATPRPKEEPPPLAMLGGSGTLLIKPSKPWSVVYVDGQKVGKTPLMGHSLPAGKHTIELRCVSCPKEQSVKQTITIKAGMEKKLSKYDFDEGGKWVN